MLNLFLIIAKHIAHSNKIRIVGGWLYWVLNLKECQNEEIKGL